MKKVDRKTSITERERIFFTKEGRPFINRWVNLKSGRKNIHSIHYKRRNYLYRFTCEDCGKESFSQKSNARFCNMSCAMTGKQNHNWKGGRYHKGKYVVLRVNKKVIPEHRFIMEEVLGRKLMPYEDVHHRNGVKDDNRPENLQVIITDPGGAFHLGIVICPYCKKDFGVK